MRTPFVSRSRATGRQLAQDRAAWVRLLNTCVAVGETAAAGEGFPGRDQAAVFAGHVMRSDRLLFPAVYASAVSARTAWREHARGFIAAAVPELKAALGRAMAASARLCLLMIEFEGREAAQAASDAAARRLGERED